MLLIPVAMGALYPFTGILLDPILAAFVAIGSALAVSAVGRVYLDLLLDQWNSFVFWLENLFS